MPTYEYECSRGHVFEVVQRITEPPLTRCKVCKAKARRLISTANFILKGGGWYADGYASASSSSGNGSHKSSGSEKSESKSGESASSPASD